ncbi:hypothetical protein SAMD00079811_07690 [Scytonema sp. HK-05]|nr:hypothetical protein SAMD00079811_07690 [Scytonema sp. HK-05]
MLDCHVLHGGKWIPFSMYYTFTLLQPSHVLHGSVQSDPQRRFFPYRVRH